MDIEWRLMTSTYTIIDMVGLWTTQLWIVDFALHCNFKNDLSHNCHLYVPLHTVHTVNTISRLDVVSEFRFEHLSSSPTQNISYRGDSFRQLPRLDKRCLTLSFSNDANGRFTLRGPRSLLQWQLSHWLSGQPRNRRETLQCCNEDLFTATTSCGHD